LAAGLRPDPLGSLSAPPDSLAAIWEPTSKGRGGEEREKREMEGLTVGYTPQSAETTEHATESFQN